MMRFAVIGCGSIAQKSVIPALLSSTVSSIAVCVDTNPERGKEINARFGLPFELSLKEAFEKYSFDAVYISSPNATHKELILTAAKNKKQILCQKPIVSCLDEAYEVVNCCKENSVALLEGFMYQHHTQHKFVNDLIDGGEIGDPFHFQAWFGFPPISLSDFRYSKKLGGGAVLDAGSYTVHAARHLFNSEPIVIHSILENEGHEVETRGTVLLDFGRGHTASLVFGFNNMYQNKYVVWGTKGLISMDRAFALPPEYHSVLTLEKQGSKKELSMEACNHFIEEIIFFVVNHKNHQYVEEWKIEIINQMKVIDKVLVRHC